MKAATAHTPQQYSPAEKALYIAFELSRRTWKLGITVGFGQKARERNVRTGDLAGLQEEIQAARKRFGLSRSAPVYSCYEAGRDGFWIDRALEEMGLQNVVDPSSIEVPRRKRRAKTDRLDVHKLLRLLIRNYLGESKVWSLVRVPSVEDEDNRHLHRELIALKRERTALINRIKGERRSSAQATMAVLARAVGASPSVGWFSPAGGPALQALAGVRPVPPASASDPRSKPNGLRSSGKTARSAARCQDDEQEEKRAQRVGGQFPPSGLDDPRGKVRVTSTQSRIAAPISRPIGDFSGTAVGAGAFILVLLS